MNALTEWLMKSKLRIILIGLLIPSIPLLMLAGFIYLRLADDMSQLLKSKIAMIVTNVEDRIESGLARDLAVGQTFATRPHLLTMIEQGDLDWMNRHLQHLIENMEHMDRVTIVNTKGIQLANYPFTHETIGMDFSGRDYFGGVTKHWSPYVSDFFLRTAEPMRYVFSISVPLIKEGVPLGILNMQPKADYFDRLLEGTIVPDGHIIIVDSKGYLVYSSFAGDEILDPIDLSALPVVQKLMQGQSGLEETIDAETNVPVFTSYRPVGDYGWGIIVDVPTRVVMAPLAGIITWMAAVTLLLLLAGGFFGYRWSLMLESEKNFAANLHQKTAELIVKNNQLTQMNEETERLNQQLADASMAKTSFLANVSHELRTPMNSIIGFSQILEDGFAGELNEKQKEYVGYIQSSGTHLLSLINDILDLSKVEAGKMVLEPGRFPVRNALEEAAAQFMDRCREQNIQLKIDLEPQADLELEADERKFKQVLLNLLSNAIKFSPDGGLVSVTASLTIKKAVGLSMPEEGSALADREFIEIAVSDTGIGISLEDQSKLFKPFSRLESACCKNYEGTGLGLALTKRLVELHHGQIWVKSEFGQGSIFTFILPLKQAG
ncbi:MAG: sensor histidine kinase [Syntrophomonadaceae bacterium]|nr:sensor histidine kinase [Syntrophomonadaceae bacterium]